VNQSPEIIVCGAGMAGISAAYYLAKAGLSGITVIDELPVLSLTSDKSTECYRNWWPDPEILALMNRSIDLLEQLSDESGDVFNMNRRGYLYVTGDPGRLSAMSESAARISKLGGGPVRRHARDSASYLPASVEGFRGEPTGADLLGPEAIRRHYPYVTGLAVGALHVRRAGWLSAQQLGAYLLQRARAMGIRVLVGRLESVRLTGGRVRGVKLADGRELGCSIFVNAAGPHLKRVGRLLELEIPVHTELHLKVGFRDHVGAIARDAPLLIWDDEQKLPWNQDELAVLESEPDTRWLTGLLPAGVHTRPEGPAESRSVLMLWDYRSHITEPQFPPPLDDQYPEVALRGLATMVPGLTAYFGRASRPHMDGGYYVKTRENRLLAGPLPPAGAYVIGALSGYGIMSACAAGELLAAHISGGKLPAYAPAFSLARYDDTTYCQNLAEWDNSGQL
jgi:glycine/D-amino acid oxidase-like deaminating enzyme